MAARLPSFLHRHESYPGGILSRCRRFANSRDSAVFYGRKGCLRVSLHLFQEGREDTGSPLPPDKAFPFRLGQVLVETFSNPMIPPGFEVGWRLNQKEPLFPKAMKGTNP